MITKHRRDALEWFRDNMGCYATPPGLLACAKELADAEAWADAADLRVGVYGTGEDDIVNAVLLSPSGKQLANMGADADIDSRYERVLRAELTVEYLERVVYPAYRRAAAMRAARAA